MKALSSTFALAAAGILVLGVASPASAAGNTIDPGDSLYAITCDVDAYPDFSLMSVNSSTAVSTPIGTGEGTEDYCAGQAAHDPSTGKSYYVRWFDDGTNLGQMDVSTGVSTDLGEFAELQGEFLVPIDVNAIAIGADGSAFAIDGASLFSLNLSTARLTEIGLLGPDIYAFAYDSKTAKFYGISTNNDLYEVDVTDGSLDFLGTVSFDTTWENNFIYSLQFDEAGTAWVEADHINDGYFASLWSFPLSNLAGTVYSGDFSDDPFYTESILIIPGAAAALASTGADSSAAPLWAGGAALLALAGASLLIVRRRRSV